MTHFDGPEEDNEKARTARLTGQIFDVYETLANYGRPWTLRELEHVTGHPQASISAQLRNLRKPRFGEFNIEKEHVGNGLYVYWLEE